MNLDSLRNLPAGAAYTAKSGQAGLKLEIKDKLLHASATCDSLQQLVFNLEEQLHQARDSLWQTEIQKEPVIIPFMAKLKWYLSGVSTTILFILIIILYRKYGKKSR